MSLEEYASVYVPQCGNCRHWVATDADGLKGACKLSEDFYPFADAAWYYKRTYFHDRCPKHEEVDS